MGHMNWQCVVCETYLVDPHGDGSPEGGVEFTSRGNYGSTVLDGGAEVAITICDECLSTLSRAGKVKEICTDRRPRERLYKQWKSI